MPQPATPCRPMHAASPAVSGPAKRTPAAYDAPELFPVGTAAELVQGPMINGPYRDVSNPGYSYWPSW